MTKLLTVTTEVENCSGCLYILDWFDTGLRDWRCDQGKRRRIVKDIWGKIPDFCPLEEKK